MVSSENHGLSPAQAHGPASAGAQGGEGTVLQHNLFIEPPLDPCHRRLHQLRLDRIYSSWLTNYSPPGRARPGPRGLAPNGTHFDGASVVLLDFAVFFVSESVRIWSDGVGFPRITTSGRFGSVSLEA